MAEGSRTLSRYLAEGALIVISILIAFGLDASWDTYRQGRDERQILEGLRVDFISAQESLDAWIEGHRGNDELATELLDLLQAAGTGSAAQVPVTTLITLVTSFTYDPPLGGVDALLASSDRRFVMLQIDDKDSSNKLVPVQNLSRN